jgi:phosphoglycerate dehydrogenase-like enzyme
MLRAAILDDYQGVALALADWARLKPEVEAVAFAEHMADPDTLVAKLESFEIIVAMRERTPFPRDVLERLPKLKLLITSGMRNAAIDVAAATARGVTVCGTDMLGYPTAELTWGLILALTRRIPREIEATRAGHWQVDLGIGLKGKTLGVIGLGKLGSQVARVGKAFEMDVIAWSQHLTSERATAAGARLVGKNELLNNADIVTVHLVLSERTRGLIGAPELALMKPSALLVNTSRGPIVGEMALAEALISRRIAGAALDVFDVEPLPRNHPLRQVDNLILTPHVGYVTLENYQQIFEQTVENIRAFLNGQPMRVLKP